MRNGSLDDAALTLDLASGARNRPTQRVPCPQRTLKTLHCVKVDGSCLDHPPFLEDVAAVVVGVGVEVAMGDFGGMG